MLYGIKDAANIRVDSQTTSKPILYANYGKTSSIDFTSDSVYAYNKTTKAIRWDKQREGVFRTEFEIFELKWISLLFGTTMSSSTVSVAKREVLDVQAGGAGASLAALPKAGSLVIFKLDSDGISHGVEQTAGTPTSAEDKFSIADKALTFNATTFATAGKVVCYYLLDGTHNTFTVDNISFPGGYTIYADSAIRGTDQKDVYVQYQLLNVKPKSNVSLSMDADLLQSPYIQ